MIDKEKYGKFFRFDEPNVDIERAKAIRDRDLAYLQSKPPVPGEAIEYIYIPTRGFMRGRLLKKGQVIRIINSEGQQDADTVIWDASNFDNVLNCFYTMFNNLKWTKWQPGDILYSKNMDKLAMISEDITDGTHAADSFCCERGLHCRYGVEGLPNCRDNLVAAMASYGFSAQDIDWGSCFTFFMDIRYKPDGSVWIPASHAKPGDYVDVMAEMDIIVAISNCPTDRGATNAYNPTPLQAVIFDPNEEYRAKVDALRR